MNRLFGQVLHHHDSAAFNLRVLAHAFATATLVEHFQKFALGRIQVQLPGAIRSVEVAGILLHVALEGPIEAVFNTTGLNKRNVAEFPGNRHSPHIVNQQGFRIGIFLHGELPAKALPAGTQVQDTAVCVRRVGFRILLDVHVQGTRLVSLGAHAKDVGDAFAQGKFLLELQIPGFLAGLLDVETDHTVVDLDIALAAPKINLPVR